ncbi:ABC transporter ATP-binding protein [Streptoverticillium reticulum]|uniref:ABC transporter ATP-binding protein n=1 Tax=Streptoverticillium reticulum TaxID=1433415 RepID=UPI0039BFD766
MEDSQGDKQGRGRARVAFPEPVDTRREAPWSRSAFDNESLRRLTGTLPSVIAQVYRMAWRIDRRDVLIMTGAQVAQGAGSAVVLAGTANAMRYVLGTGEVAHRLDQALPALALIAAAAGLVRIATGFSSWAAGRLKPRLGSAADTAIVETMMSVELAAFHRPDFAERRNSAEIGALRCDRLLYDGQQFMAALIKLAAAFGVLTVLHPLMLAVLVLAVVPAGVGAMMEAKIEHRTQTRARADQTVRGLMRWFLTTSTLAGEVRGNSMHPFFSFWYRAMSVRLDRRELHGVNRQLRVNLLFGVAGGVCLLVAWGTLAWLTVGGVMSLALAATAVLAVRTALGNLRELVHYAATLFESSLYLGDWKEFVENGKALVPARGSAPVPASPQTIRLERASFSYPNKPSPAVNEVSLSLRAGQIVAVIGENGSGKSTLTRLMTGMYTPDKGRVLWDGTDLADADMRRVWEQTGVLTQDFAKNWPLCARDNVTLGQPTEEGDHRVWGVLEAVGLREVFEEFPRGLDSVLNPDFHGGVTLSGGQWQRLACARVLYRKPPVVILDEPTSEMDTRGEHAMFELMRTIAPGRITVVITHQVINARIADHIIVMERGRITEQGTFDQLVSAGGLFQELYELSQDR